MVTAFCRSSWEIRDRVSSMDSFFKAAILAATDMMESVFLKGRLASMSVKWV